MASEIAKEISKAGNMALVTPFPKLWYEKKNQYAPMYGALDKLRQLRNEIHETHYVDDTSLSNWLEKAEPLWKKIVEHAEPLLKYRLLFVEGPIDFDEIDKDYIHYQVRWLMGEHFVPRVERVKWAVKLNRNRLYLKDMKEERFLCLHPFLIYEHCKVTKSRECSCIDNIMEDAVAFSTFRFPYRWKDATILTEIAAMLLRKEN